jgi:hypothetical protein
MKFNENDINQSLQQIEVLLNKIDSRFKREHEQTFLDTADLCIAMGISKRTAQEWRTNKIIGYSKIGGKYYYRLKDILEMLNRYYTPANY